MLGHSRSNLPNCISREWKTQPNRGFAKGWFPKGWFWRMFPRNENRNERTFAKTTLLRNHPFISRWALLVVDKRVVSKRVVSADVPPERKPERGYVRQNWGSNFDPHPQPQNSLLRIFPSATRSRMEILTKENLVGAKIAPTAVSRTFTPLVRRTRFP